LIFTVTATSEGLFAPLEGCWFLLGGIIILLHPFLALYFKPSNVYIFSFLVEIPLWQKWNHQNATNDVITIVCHQLQVLFPLLEMLLAMLDGYTVGTTWKPLSLLWHARSLTEKSVVWPKSITYRQKLSSRWVLNLLLRLLVNLMPGSLQAEGWPVSCSLTTKTQNMDQNSHISQIEPRNFGNLTISSFLQHTPRASVPPVFYTPPAFWAILTSCDLQKTMPLFPKRTWSPAQLFTYPLGFVLLYTTVS
jgi:hypothetical protein